MNTTMATTTTTTCSQGTSPNPQYQAKSCVSPPQEMYPAATQNQNQQHTQPYHQPSAHQAEPLQQIHAIQQSQQQSNTQFSHLMQAAPQTIQQPAIDYTHLMKATPEKRAPVNDFTNLMQAAPQSNALSTFTSTTIKVERYDGANAGGVARKAAEAMGENGVQLFQHKVQTIIRGMGVCPMNWPWYNMEEGYLCAEGIHFVYHKDIDMAFERPGWVPQVTFVNTMYDPDSKITGFSSGLHPPLVDFFQPMHRAHKEYMREARNLGAVGSWSQGRPDLGCEVEGCLRGIGEISRNAFNRGLREAGWFLLPLAAPKWLTPILPSIYRFSQFFPTQNTVLYIFFGCNKLGSLHSTGRAIFLQQQHHPSHKDALFRQSTTANMPDLTSREYTPLTMWPFLNDPGDLECHVVGDHFVTARCEQCTRCDCEPIAHFLMATCRHDDSCHNQVPHFRHDKPIMIAIKGIVRDPNTPISVAGVGIYCNIGSRYNTSITIRDHFRSPEEDRRPELHAAIAALKLIKLCLGQEVFRNDTKQIIIKTDSRAVVTHMAATINVLRNHGFERVNGEIMPDAQLISDLDHLVEEVVGMNMKVRFWQCLPEMNAEATRLANAALDGRASWEVQGFADGHDPKHFIIDDDLDD
ncbi:hypothetical protein Q7P37_002574 [Cladosporium fusiforme]